MFLKTKSGRRIELPTPQEGTAINVTAMSDLEAIPMTDAEWNAVKPLVMLGRPPVDLAAERITIRLSRWRTFH